jgi:uncharacterized protein YuzE
MKQQKLNLYYDSKADILELIIGEPSSCVFEEVDDDLFEARDEKTNELKGYKIFNLTKRKGAEWLKKVKINLPAGVNISN